MKKILSLTLFFSILLPMITLATVYYEYAPDPWNSQRYFNTSGYVEQVFQTRKDILLTGFDFWLDNSGSTDDITLTLYDEFGSVLSTKIVSLSSTPSKPGGKKFHVDLNSNILLSGYSTYWVRISSLPWMGVYYSPTTVFLTHNEDVISPYLQGRARIDGEDQDFSFKYALHYLPPEGGGASVEEGAVVVEQLEPGVPIQTVVTNARVVAKTHHSVTLAWTTNVAADSGATLRTQLNPLYVVASGYDPTLELEHWLTIGGLGPDQLYFADVFSRQLDQNEELLTTYTIGFKTEKTSANAIVEDPINGEDTPPEDVAPEEGSEFVVVPDEVTDELGQAAGENEEGAIAGFDQINTAEQQLPPGIEGSSAGGDVKFSWTEPEDGPPRDGYRIDIFDEEHNLERQLYVDADATEADIAQLTAGKHNIVIYANDDQTFKKVAAPTDFLIRKGVSPIIWIGLAVLLIIGTTIGLSVWRYKKDQIQLAKFTNQ